jgi:hypothetical protein
VVYICFISFIFFQKFFSVAPFISFLGCISLFFISYGSLCLSDICKSLTLYHIICSSYLNLSLAIFCSASSPKSLFSECSSLVPTLLLFYSSLILFSVLSCI